MFEGFEEFDIAVSDTHIHGRRGGSGRPLLLLHGFPQTHLIRRDVALALAAECTVVCADLRGYGQSGCPPSDANHVPYSKRAMARDMIELMAALGFDRFGVAGHDRGGRVAYRAALDHPENVACAAVLDVLPIDVSWDLADDRLALGFWPWSLLAQPEPLAERLLRAAPGAVLDNALGGEWGTPAETFDDEVRRAYRTALDDPEHVHAICEEYRAAATIDRDHDATDRAAGRRVTQPLLALWSGRGPLSMWYVDQDGPLALWGDFAADVHAARSMADTSSPRNTRLRPQRRCGPSSVPSIQRHPECGGGPRRSHRFPAMSTKTATAPYGSLRGSVTNSTPASVMR